MGRMLDRLRKKDKKGLFTRTQTAIGYPTGFLPLDYRNGYMVQVRDLDDNIVKEYMSGGIVGGSFNTFIGKSGVAKTTAAVQIGMNIVKPFEDAFVQHYDLEQALTYTRIKNVTGATQRDLDEKYVLKQERTYIEDIFDGIMEIARDKEEFRDELMYDTGLLNEFNQPIKAFVPTVVIIDSIPTVTFRPSKENSEEMEGGTYANRVAKSLSQFYKKSTPIIKTYNIIVIAINHINQKIEINPMMKSQPQLLHMKMDESMPGGNAPIYYAHNLLKFVSAGKIKAEDEGFDGFKARIEFLKSRTNKAGQSCELIYNQELGFDPIMTMYNYANDRNLIEGRNPYRYVTGFKDVKFDSRKFRKHFLENEQLRFALMDQSLPMLERDLSRVDPNEATAAISDMELANIYANLAEGSEGEELVPDGTFADNTEAAKKISKSKKAS
jgi:RecA/RadA recombinase